MGAGHCQWGGLTDRNICNIYGGAHLASRYHAMLRFWDFYQFWHLANYTANLPILGNLSKAGLPSFSKFWQVARISWHAAKSTPHDPPWSWIVTHIAPVTKIGQEKAYSKDFWPWPLTYDPDLPKRVKPYSSPILIPKIRFISSSAEAGGRRKDGRKARKYIKIKDGFHSLRPTRGSLKLIFTKLVDLISLLQSNHKPMGLYNYIPIGLWWGCSNDKWWRWASRTPRGGLKLPL